jgi:hypothetical protein
MYLDYNLYENIKAFDTVKNENNKYVDNKTLVMMSDKGENPVYIDQKTGKINKKKRFGKSIANKAPAKLIEIINRKLTYQKKEIKKINTYTVKASQYNHIEDSFEKKKLNERWNILKSKKIQRDLYSAFLIMNVNEKLEKVDRKLCIRHYKQFKKNHDKEIKRIKNSKSNKLASMGI